MTIKEQANAMLSECGILEVLKQFGEAHLHGSHDLDLMVWPELDFGILMKDLSFSSPFELVAALSKKVYPTTSMVINQIDRKPIFPMKVENNALIDFRFLHQNVEWKLDMVLVSKDVERTGPLYNQDVRRYLTPDNHRIVKTIKEQLIHSPYYRKSRWEFTDRSQYFGANDVYKAVFGQGVTNVDQFVGYLKHVRGIDIPGEPEVSVGGNQACE